MPLSETMAVDLARIGLGHVARAFPHKLDHVLAHEGDAAESMSPEALHPLFFGSFDWHSCCHTYWMLARILRRFPDCAAAPDIRALFDARITPPAVGAECAYFERPTSRGFERPYGWAWFLKLAAELATFPEQRWSAALRPLADIIVARFQAFLPLAVYPIRVGTHGNTAFALALASDYAAVTRDEGLAAAFRGAALRWYGDDRDCQAWEPGGEDFLSSALTEAECMRWLLPPEPFAAWFDGFLPRLAEQKPASLFAPVGSTDRSDGKLAHLDGLNLSRAWCWRALASALPAGDPRRPVMSAAASSHLAAGLPFVAGDYMGEHWLGSFALLALDE